MAWITSTDIEPIVRADLSGDSYIDGLIDQVQGLAEVEIGEQTEPVGNALAAVFAQIVVRAWRQSKGIEDNPEGVNQETIGGYSYSMPQSMAGFGLTNAEKKALKKAVGRTGLWIQRTTRADRLETAGPESHNQAPPEWDDWSI